MRRYLTLGDVLPFVLAMALVVAAGCAFFKAAGRAAAVGAGGALGAAAGSPAGPAGTLGGAAAGAGATYAVMENSELRSGSLQGDEAKQKEMENLRLALAAATGDLRAKDVVISSLNYDMGVLREARERADGYASWLKSFFVKVAAGGFLVRNLLVIVQLAKALARKRWISALKWFWHMFWPVRPKEA